MGTKLYVGNLPYDVMEGELHDYFAAVGNVVNCELMLDRVTGKPRGFAFIEMGSQEDANKAVAELDGKDFQGRRLRVNEARPKEDRPPRRDFDGGGYGGGGGGGGGGRGGHGGGGGRRDFGGPRRG